MNTIVAEGNTELIEFIAAEIARSGPVSFRWFMEQALYHPQYGYYSCGKARVGREGDFFTNVSVGPLFGRLMASQFIEMWEALGRPQPFCILEQGANRGDFAADVLEELEKTELFPGLVYRIVEPFDPLQEHQMEKLRTWGEKVQWHKSLEELEPFCGIHFSNELLDAMPVHLAHFYLGVWNERLVDWRGDHEFFFLDVPTEFPELPVIRDEDYQTEVNRDVLTWVDQVASKIKRGFILAIDYGHPREEFFSPYRGGGTLTCYSKHTKIDNPLINIGECDITAHVEFTSVIERAKAGGMSLCGFTDQQRYLVALAKPYLMEMGADPKALLGFRTLMHPSMMGGAFKVLALQKGVTATLRGFHGIMGAAF